MQAASQVTFAVRLQGDCQFCYASNGNMLITISEFVNRPPQLLPNSSILSYWIKFTADIVAGNALLVPVGNSVEELRQRQSSPQIFVETGQRAVEGFRLLSGNEAQSYRFEALSNLGDYELTGRISSVLNQENGEILIISVRVGSCRFDLTADDTGIIRVEDGDWVQFRVLELALFDENY